MLADNLLRIGLLVQEFCDGDVRSEEVLVDGVLERRERFGLNGVSMLGGRVIKVAVLDV